MAQPLFQVLFGVHAVSETIFPALKRMGYGLRDLWRILMNFACAVGVAGREVEFGIRDFEVLHPIWKVAWHSTERL